MATEPIRDKNQTAALSLYFKDKGQYRNLTLIIMGLYTALRISDLLRLKWDDVYDFRANRVKDVLKLSETKTGKTVSIALNKEIVSALNQLLSFTAAAPSDAIFKSKKTKKAIGRTQAYRIIRDAADALAFQNRVSCHSLRKTLGYHAWKEGVSPAVIMDIYNHSSFAVTKRYIGVTQDDKNEVYLGLDFN
ncbi:MAG: tyrosine-type recombinase/integrase [Oscillospiraceae bacterium]|nr:tyrosine-type recombinase/integrase [Oscillospiraceae bacterium]MCL2278735.1 tyrosine-type recombinase/integrase [Oscillospiraceae bacterium]